MKTYQLQKIETSFHNYTAQFCENNNLHAMQQLKLAHCLRVAQNCKKIAGSFFLDENHRNVSVAIGLLHDIGRFKQWQEYETFSDIKSVDHGELGIKVIHEIGIINLTTLSTQKTIITAIQLHNKKTLPDNIPSKALQHLNIIREADRLDIINVVLTAIETGEIKRQPEILWNSAINGPVSTKILNAFKTGKSVNYADLKSMSDWLILHLQWICLLKYQGSVSTILEQKIIDRFRKIIPSQNNKTMNQCFEMTLCHLKTNSTATITSQNRL
ncbi:MAG: HD domain-containing protein [Desulfotalea sp.]